MNIAAPTDRLLSQQDRLKHIELKLRFLGRVGRSDLMERFGIQSAAASRDLSLYRELAPDNINYDKREKCYLLGDSFSPLFEAPVGQVLSWLAEQLGDVVIPCSDQLLPCLFPARLSSPDATVLACITRAIHAEHVLRIDYHSISSGKTQREVAPFALIDTGLRWHVRGYDRKRQAFRDFVLTRIQNPEPVPGGGPENHEKPDHDVQWSRLVELELVPHPDKSRPEITCMDFDMPAGVLQLILRAAVVGYALRKWSVDCSPDHHLAGPEYRLWLKDHLTLYGVETAALAPGYPADPKAAS